jgi:ATP-grasp domain, R2K clade family 2
MVTAYVYDFTADNVRSACTYSAYLGFKFLGADLQIAKNSAEIKDENPENIAIGGVGFVVDRLNKLGVPLEYYDYPEELEEFLGRKVWISTINQVAAELPFAFVKPKDDDKLFTGRVVRSTKDLIGTGSQTGDIPVYCSEVVNMITEFRTFVRYGKIIGIKQYSGNYRLKPDYDIIEKAVKQFKNCPNAYGIDFCVTDDNKTLLVEVNDAYAIGNYGLDVIDYAKFLYTRWAQLAKSKDWYNF